MNSRHLPDFWANQEKHCEFDSDIDEDTPIRKDTFLEPVRRDSTEGKMDTNAMKNKGGIKSEDRETFQGQSKVSPPQKDISMIVLDANLIDIPVQFDDETHAGFKSTFDHTKPNHQNISRIAKRDTSRQEKNTSEGAVKICQDLKSVLLEAAHKVRVAEEQKDDLAVRSRSFKNQVK